MMLLIEAIISSILYRIGGAGKEEIPFANSQYRDIGCPVLVSIVLIQGGIPWFIALASGLIVLGFIRTYWDFITGDDNMYLHGFGIGLGMVPLYWYGIHWWAILAYTAVLVITIGGLNTFCYRVRVPFSVWIEECYRGFVIIYAMKLLFIL